MNVEYVADTAGTEHIPYTIGSGNVFADLDFEEPNEALLKAELARRISEIIDGRGLTQTAAAKLLGVDQPKVSALLRGRLKGFTIDRLVRYAAAFGQEVEVVVRPREANDHPAEEACSVSIPRSLYASLAEGAADQGVDVDAYAATLLARGNALFHTKHYPRAIRRVHRPHRSA